MDVRTIANLYYDAWMSHAGDMSGVPLADDFVFTGPVASFDTADGYRSMARQAGAAVRSFQVRHQFASGELVCSVIDWEMAMLPGMLTAAELLQIRDGRIVRGELIYDAQPLREAMAQPPITGLLERCYQSTAETLSLIDDTGWAAPSGCTGWTVRQAGNHLIGALALLAKIARAEPIDPAELDAQRTADTDHLGANPVEALQESAARSLAAFSDPVVLERQFALPGPGFSGLRLATVSMLESLVHGWDIASGAGVRYQPDDAVVAAAAQYAGKAIGDAQRGTLFGPAIPAPADADPFTAGALVLADSSTWEPGMAVDVRPTVLIRRARGDVAAFMFDPANDLRLPTWSTPTPTPTPTSTRPWPAHVIFFTYGECCAAGSQL